MDQVLRQFDEMGAAARAIRPPYYELARWLEDADPAVLSSRRAQAELLFRRIGITFAVYGAEEAAERLIPFDILPRIIARSEWAMLEQGLIQRVKALNLFLADLYGRREILDANIVPSELIYRNPAFRPEMMNWRAPHGVYVHIAGVDIVRTDENSFYVLEDNARTPSGVSYMLENREVMLRLFPDLFSLHKVAPVEDYPDHLLRTLRSVAPPGGNASPLVALLTPGQFN
ncbi:MAG: circularly permuted type 2 ATP-grasp protein, partial [Methylocystis sp.]|nr:circularly permuted type 2 ATP-grasp protein [Methylocystis sp.]